jgi:hypothetical protein
MTHSVAEINPRANNIIFQPILEFQKHFHYTEANAVKLSTFQ